MTYQEFVSGPDARQRYWARSHLGWGRMRRADPNAGHRALARLAPELLITQNVDGLHERVGTPRLVALHGRIADVVCLGCRVTSTRSSLHERLGRAQPGLRRAARRRRRPPRRGRRARGDGRVRRARLHGVRRRAQARRRVLRRERPAAAGRALLRRRRGARRHRRRPAGRRVQPDRDVRAPVRAPGGQARGAGGDRQPGHDARRRARHVQGRGGVQRVPRRPRRAEAGDQPSSDSRDSSPSRSTTSWSARSWTAGSRPATRSRARSSGSRALTSNV